MVCVIKVRVYARPRKKNTWQTRGEMEETAVEGKRSDTERGDKTADRKKRRKERSVFSVDERMREKRKARKQDDVYTYVKWHEWRTAR